MAHVILGALIFATTLALIMIRPARFSEAMIAACGGLLMLVFGIITPSDATSTVLGQGNIYGFFLGLMLISAIADTAGIFDMIAYQVARLAGGSSLRLYLAVFAAGAIITAFLLNDATALTSG